MVIPQMEICSFQFQRPSEVSFAIVQSWEESLKTKQKEARKRIFACMETLHEFVMSEDICQEALVRSAVAA